jgi:hypothetical protein
MKFTDHLKETQLQDFFSFGYAHMGISQANVTDPEKFILKASEYFYSDKSLFDVLVGLLEHRIAHLINVERLMAIAKTETDTNKLILVYLALRLQKVDPRYKAIVRRIKYKKLSPQSIPSDYQDKRLIKRWGEDPYFKKSNLSLPNFFGEDARKFFELKTILEMNPWLAAKILGCQRATAYNIWATLEHTPNLRKSDLFTRQELPKLVKTLNL